MHMIELCVKKSLISRTKILVDMRKGDENELWHNLTNSMNDTLRAVERRTCLPGLVPANVLLKKENQELKTSKWESDHYLAFTRLSLFHLAL